MSTPDTPEGPPTLERRRRERLMQLIRQQDAALDRAQRGEEVLSPGFVRHFQDAAARSLGHSPADRLLSLSLRPRR